MFMKGYKERSEYSCLLLVASAFDVGLQYLLG